MSEHGSTEEQDVAVRVANLEAAKTIAGIIEKAIRSGGRPSLSVAVLHLKALSVSCAGLWFFVLH